MREKFLNKYKQVLLHIGSIIILFGLPVLFNDFYQYGRWFDIMRDWLPLISFTIVFYINYLFLIDKYFFNKKNIQFITINILIFAVIITAAHAAHDFVWKNFEHEVRNNVHRPSEIFILYSQFFSLVVSAIVSIAVKSVQRNSRIEREKKEIEKAHLETELNQLKQQINPHFLFNTLNNIYSLIVKDQSKAQEAVHKLSHMMRYVLYESQSDFLPLSKEIAFIKNFISLMKLRLPENVKLEINITECSEEFFIAPLILITFIENAFKHSAGTVKNPFIKINIDLNDGMLIYLTSNSIGSEQNLESKNSGIGLINLRKRLDLLYGNDYSLSTYSKDNIFYSELKLKLRR